jgi:hypothetical protein
MAGMYKQCLTNYYRLCDVPLGLTLWMKAMTYSYKELLLLVAGDSYLAISPSGTTLVGWLSEVNPEKL